MAGGLGRRGLQPFASASSKPARSWALATLQAWGGAIGQVSVFTARARPSTRLRRRSGLGRGRARADARVGAAVAFPSGRSHFGAGCRQAGLRRARHTELRPASSVGCPAVRRLLVLIVLAGLLAACSSSGKSAAPENTATTVPTATATTTPTCTVHSPTKLTRIDEIENVAGKARYTLVHIPAHWDGQLPAPGRALVPRSRSVHGLAAIHGRLCRAQRQGQLHRRVSAGRAVEGELRCGVGPQGHDRGAA